MECVSSGDAVGDPIRGGEVVTQEGGEYRKWELGTTAGVRVCCWGEGYYGWVNVAGPDGGCRAICDVDGELGCRRLLSGRWMEYMVYSQNYGDCLLRPSAGQLLQCTPF